MLIFSGTAQATTTINHQFTPATIFPGDTSKYRITIANTSLVSLTSAKVTEVFPAAITIGSPANITNSCGFTVSAATTGTSTVYLTAGTIPAGTGVVDGQCYFELDVTATTDGNHIATIPANTTPTASASGYTAKEAAVDVWNTTPASATLAVTHMDPPTGSKSFGSAIVGDPSTLTITLANPNAGANLPLTSFTDTLPSGMVVANPPSASTSCSGVGAANGSVSATAGGSTITLTGGTIGRSGVCTVSVKVLVASITGTTQNFTNSLGSGAIGNSRGLTSPAFGTTQAFTTPIGVSKSFATRTISAGQPSLMTVRLSNANTTTALDITSFTDNLSGTTLKILNTSSSPVAALANPTVTCTGTGAVNGTLTATPDLLNQTITLSGAKAGPGGACTITAYLTSNSDGVHTNTIAANAVANPNNYASPAASDWLQANAQLTVHKSVQPDSYNEHQGYVAPGQWAKFTVAISNWAPGAVTAVGFKDVLPANGANQMLLFNAGSGYYTTAGNCSGGTWTGTNAAGVSTGVAPTASDAGLQWANGTITYGGGVAGVCTISFWGKLPDSAATGLNFSNDIPVNTITATGPDGAVHNTDGSTAVVTSVSKVAVSKAFSPVAISQGGISTLSISIANRVLGAMTGINLTDNLPAGLTLAANPAATNSCNGSLQAFPGDNKLVLSGGSIAARPGLSQESGCTITARVTGTALGFHTNTIYPADFTSVANSETLTIPASVAAILDISTGLSGVKSFSPSAVNLGGTARATITVINTSNRRLTNIAVDDDTFGTGLYVANPANSASNCPGSPVLVVNPGTSRARLLGATLDTGKSCDFSFDVMAASGDGPWTNTIPSGKITSAEGLTSTSAITASLLEAPSDININKSFNPVLISGGQPSVLQIDLTNPSSYTMLDGVGFTDTFPEGVKVYAVPNASTTCAGGTLTAIPGDGKITFAGATLAQNSTCYVYVTVTSFKFLNLTNTIPAGSVVSEEGYTNPQAASASLSTLQALGVSKAFSPAYIIPGAISTLRINLINTFDPNAPTPITLHNVSFTDTLPAGVLIAGTPNVSTDCPGTGTGGLAAIATANNGTSNGLVTISLGTIAPGTSCAISVDVVASALGSYNNIIPANAVTTTEGIPNQEAANAILYVVDQPSIDKSFASSTVNPGQSTTLTVTITNPSTAGLTGVALTDTFPGGLAIASMPNLGGTCTAIANGVVIANPGGNTLSLIGASIPAGDSCTVLADVVSNSPGSYINNLGPGSLVSDQGVTNTATATATLTVNQLPTVGKAFNPVSMTVGGTSTLTIILGNDNPGGITLTSDFVDALPGNLLVDSNPSVGGTCTTASITAMAGATSITYASGATIPPGGCTITVDVTSALAGLYTNTIAASQLTTSTGVNQNPAVASLAVGAGVLAPPTLAKTFSPATIFSGGTSALTLTLGNPNSSALTLSGLFTDTLPSGVVVAVTPNIRGTCSSGSVTATAGGGAISYANGATIPGGGCTIVVDVTSSSPGSYTNSLATTVLTTNGGSPAQPATAGLVVQTLVPPTLFKSFAPSTINPGGISALTISLGNANASALTLSAPLVDTLPADVVVAATPNILGTCTVGSIAAIAGGSTISYASGATIPSGGCTIIVDVTSSVSGGPYTNTIAAGALQSTQAGNSTAAATANLFVNPPQPPSINKSFAPSEIVSGGTATLTLSLGNNNLSGTILTSDLIDNLPANLVIAATPNLQVVGACTSAKVVANAGASSLTYQSGGAIPAGGCSISVAVTSVAGSIYTNTIAAGALKTGYGNNAVGTSATLKVKEPPTLAKVFSPNTIQQGTTSTLTVTLGNPNTYATTLTAALTDTLPANLVIANPPSVGGSCAGGVTAVAGGSAITYASGATIPAGGCTVTVHVTSATIGPYTNTLAANALQTDVGSNASSASASLTVYQLPTLGKAFAPAEIATGESSALTITLNNGNPGATTLTATLTDTMPVNLVLANPPNIRGTCTTGSVTATAGQRVVSYASGASIPSGGCTIIVDVTSATGANYTNTIAAGALQTSYGNNAAPATADLKVKAPPTLAKTFSPIHILPGATSTLTLTLGNPNTNYAIALSANLVDTLPTNVVVATTPGIGGTCTTGSVTAVAGAGTITYASGASIPSGGCTITVNVTSSTLGIYTNTLAAGDLTTDVGSNLAPVQAVLTVRDLPTIGKAFLPTEVVVNTVSTLTLTLGNGNAFPLTLTAALTDSLPTNLRVAATPNVVKTCPGTVTAVANATSITYAIGATIPAGGCTIAIDVSSATGANYTNTLAAGALQTDYENNASGTSAILKVKAPPTIGKTFSVAQVLPNTNATLTLTLGNPNTNYAIALTSALVDTLPANLVLGSPATIGGTCISTNPGKVTAVAGGTSVTYVSGATIPSGSCTITVPVRSATLGIYTNTIAAGGLVTDVGTNAAQAQATITVRNLPTLAKVFAPTAIDTGGVATLTLTLGNTNPLAITLSQALTDSLPSGMTVAAVPNVVKTCPGTVTASAGAGSIVYANGATIPSAGCTIAVDVTASNGANYTNTIAANTLRTNYGNAAAVTTATLKVKVPPTVTKAFAPIQILPGATAQLTITLSNPNTYTATNVASYPLTLAMNLVDSLPSNLVIAPTPNKGGTCTQGSITATAGASTISYASGASIPAGGCTILVDVTSSTLGTYTNTIAAGALQTTDSTANAAPASADLTVRNLPTVTKAFAPAAIVKGGTSRLTISLGDGNPVALTLSAALTDNLPAGLVVATPNNLVKNCPGSVTAAAGSTSITYANGSTIPTGGCTIAVDIQATTSLGTIYSNAIAINALQTNYGNNVSAATAELKIMDPPTLSKAFSPTSIRVVNGGNATLTLNLGNPNTYTITLAMDMVDSLPTGLVLATPATLGGSCNQSNVLAADGGTTVTFINGATIPSGGCTITVPVTGASGANPGIYLNDMNFNPLRTDVGVSGRASATLTLSPVADLQVEKTVSPAPPTEVAFGANVSFVVTLTNLGPSTATNVWARDLLPNGYTFVSAIPSQGTYTNGTGYWVVGELAKDAVVTMTVTAKVLTFGTFTNTAATFKTDAFDPVAGNNSAAATPTLPHMEVCDVNRDQKINSVDTSAIFASRNQRATVGDPKDLDGDGYITINDVRGCALRCDNANCVP